MSEVRRKPFFCGSPIVSQGWIVDEFGKLVKVYDQSTDVLHYPDDADDWVCNTCQYTAKGRDFYDTEETLIKYMMKMGESLNSEFGRNLVDLCCNTLVRKKNRTGTVRYRRVQKKQGMPCFF